MKNSIQQRPAISYQENSLVRNKPIKYRVGAVPFIVEDSKIYFILGIDNRYKEITDFGGKIKTDKKSNIAEDKIRGAIRELTEELNYLVEKSHFLKQDQKLSIKVVEDTENQSMTMIIPIHIESFEELRNQFHLIRKHRLYGYSEMSDIVKVEVHELKRSLTENPNKFYERIRSNLQELVNIMINEDSSEISDRNQ